jgi:hypothetical protein
LTQPAAAPGEAPPRSIFARRWLWGVAGAVLVAGAVAALVALNPSYPDASFGRATATPTGHSP